MKGTRCLNCGETRWSLLPMATAQSPPTAARCCVCGGPLVEERRQPGRAGTLTRFVKERRDRGTPPADRSLLL